ncbi:hypothetical protein IF1G_00701 [Cordyceps javanica]|uniref:Uncharacterized protein n=1 Tax=Cordyceps javanica TaxID=43265 RepID=A0A545VGL0_9HYPO|nr:hypothetical protein IF1G_00701 [Cordyceps javanica]
MQCNAHGRCANLHQRGKEVKTARGTARAKLETGCNLPMLRTACKKERRLLQDMHFTRLRDTRPIDELPELLLPVMEGTEEPVRPFSSTLLQYRSRTRQNEVVFTTQYTAERLSTTASF